MCSLKAGCVKADSPKAGSLKADSPKAGSLKLQILWDCVIMTTAFWILGDTTHGQASDVALPGILDDTDRDTCSLFSTNLI